MEDESRARRVLDDVALIATHAEAWVCILGWVMSAAGFVLFGVAAFTSDHPGGFPPLVVAGFGLLVLGIVVSRVALTILRRRRSDAFPAVLHGALDPRGNRGSFLDAVRFMRDARRAHRAAGPSS